MGQHAMGTSMRKRLHVNDLITEPGTFEADIGGLYSYTSGGFTLPSAFKYTPEGDSLYWGRTEYSVAFDSVSSAIDTGAARSTQFSDRLTMAATSVLFDSEHFDIAVAPQLTTFLRDQSGVRLGATVIGRYDGGGNSIAFTASWSGATSASDANPAGVWDFGAGWGHHLATSGALNRITPHANVILEKSTGFAHTLALYGGVAYQLTERLSVDVTGQRLGLTGIGPDRQVLVGFTLNFGKMH
jgi:hypothetical protein